MGVFDNCSVLFELKHLSFKEKKKLKSAVTENGGSISFVINEQCSLVVTSDVSNLSSNRLRSIQKHYTPVVSLDYVHSCVERGTLLPVDGYELVPPCASPDPLPLNPPWRASTTYQAEQPSGQDSAVPADETFRTYKESDSDLPAFPDDFQVAKYSFFAKANSSTWCVLELQSSRTQQGQCYRVVRYWKDDVAATKVAVRDQLVFLSTSEKALDVYEALTDQLDSSGLQRMSSIPPEVPHLGSAPLQQLLLEEKLNTGSLSQEVAVFVEMLWTEALGCLSNILRVSTNQLSLNDGSRAEGLLLQAQKKLKEGNQSEASSLLKEVYVLLPHREPRPPFPTARFLSQKLDLCQLIRDVLNVSEMNLRTPEPSCVGKYRALQCSIEAVPPDSTVFQNVADLLHDSPVQIQQIMRVSRRVELQTFKSDLGNIKPLLHSSSPSNFVGILSRGLLLPRVGVEHHGIERTDAGNLGSGIYFSDSMSTSLKYSKPSQTDGSRLLLVCDVALGRCKNIYERDQTLSQAPEGHHSVHGVRCTHTTQTDFEDDEFVVYAPDQVKVKYVVLFTVEGDQLKDFQPAVNTSAEPGIPAADEELVSVADDIENIKNPLDGVTAGLLDSSGQQLPLQAVHVKCKLMDLLSQVVIFQKYTNLSSVAIEAKYVFPLDDSAAVCGFEAFINGKHVVGQVKEKETARKEYKQAIEKGHGAYLMDQEAPDVFTISVGNLPPGATVLIKVTFVSELVIRDGKILFSLPGSVAPWQESAALNQTTQVSVEKVRVTEEAAGSREFTLELSVEMPYEIYDLVCITHKVMIKETDCKAVVRILPGQVMGPDGFQLSIQLTEVHLPRMWVEKHPDKDSQACMLVFYPKIDLDSDFKVEELVLLLDTSESMRGESLRQAQNIALHVLKKIENDVRINVVLFGTDHAEAFLKAQPLSQVHQAAQTFIKRCSPAGGSTELWRPLRALSLMPPSRGIRALLLLSDGHIQNAALTLQLLRDNVQHSRLFTCGVSPTANRHMLRALAQAGGGAYEFFDSKTKHNWAGKALRQMERLSGPHCSSISVKWQQFNPTAPSPVQAPKQLSALFSDCHTLVYGFVPHCTQATLLGNLHGQELNTMVSTTELQKTTGTFLHKLTARALIRDYEDGSLDTAEAEHEGKKAELKSFVIELSKEFSILSQFTSFVAIEERDSTQPEDGITDIPKLIAEEDVDFLPYIGWTFPPAVQEAEDIEISSSSLAGSQVSEGSDEEECYLIGSSESEEEWICKARKAKPKEGKSSEESDEEAAMLSENISADARKSTSEEEVPVLPDVMGSLEDREAESSEESDEERRYLFMPSKKEGRYRSKPSRAQLSSRVDFESVFLGNRAEALKGKASILPAPNRARAAPPPGYSPTSPSYTPPVLLGASVPATGLFSPAFGTTGYGALTGQSGLFGSSRAAASSPMLHSYAPTPAVAQGAFEAASRRFRSAPNAPIVDLQTFTFSSAAPQPEADRAPCSEPEVQHSTEVKMSGWEKEFQGRRESYDSQPLRRRSFHQNMSFHLPPPPPPCAPGVPRASLDVLPPPCPPGVPRASLDVPPPPCPPGVPHVASLDVLPPPCPPGVPRASLDVLPPPCPPGVPHVASLDVLPPPCPPGVPRASLDVLPPPCPPGVLRASLDVLPPRSTGYAHMPPLDLSFFSSSPSPLDGSPSSYVSLSTQASVRHKLEKKLKVSAVEAPPDEKLMKPKKRRHYFCGFLAPPGLPSVESRDPDPEELKHKWTKIFQLQHSEGFWELTTELGDLLNLNVDVFGNVFLRNKGINSLGMKAHADILRMVATLLVLQLLKMEKQEEGKLLRSLFRLDESSLLRPERWEQVKKAVDWMCWADRQYPCICSRLELGLNWESTTRQLLGFDSFPPFSPLIGLNLRPTATPQRL